MKRQILTFAFLAAVAVGAAFAGTKSSATQPSKDELTSGNCVRNVDCQPGPAADCFFNNNLQTGENILGDCSEPLEAIQP